MSTYVAAFLCTMRQNTSVFKLNHLIVYLFFTR